MYITHVFVYTDDVLVYVCAALGKLRLRSLLVTGNPLKLIPRSVQVPNLQLPKLQLPKLQLPTLLRPTEL